MIKKQSIWITTAILGVMAIVSSILFGVYFQKYDKLKAATENYFGGHKITIKADFLNDATEDVEKIYTSEKKDKTLADLMLRYDSDFGLGDPGIYGRQVETIYGTKAVWADGSWWQVTSKSYVSHYPDSLGTSTDVSAPNALNVGVSFVYLLYNEVITFIETEA